MPKIVYDDGREEEIELIGGGREVGQKEYFKFTKVDRSAEQLRDMLTHVMQDRQQQNLLPFEIVQSMLLTIGNSEFADNLWDLVSEAHKATITDHPNVYIDKVVKDFLKKWGLRS